MGKNCGADAFSRKTALKFNLTDHFISNYNKLDQIFKFRNKDCGHCHLNTSVRKCNSAAKMTSHA